LYLKLAGREKRPMALAVTFFTWLFVYGLFERGPRISFPYGLLLTWVKKSFPSKEENTLSLRVRHVCRDHGRRQDYNASLIKSLTFRATRRCDGFNSEKEVYNAKQTNQNRTPGS